MDLLISCISRSLLLLFSNYLYQHILNYKKKYYDRFLAHIII